MKRISLLLVALSATSLVSLSQSLLMELPGKVIKFKLLQPCRKTRCGI